jgi:hypothetical protein
MTTPTPPPGARNDPRSDARHGRLDPRKRERRVVIVAFGVSFVLHVLGVLLYPLLLAPVEGPGRRPDARAEAERPQGTEIIRILAIPEDRLERPEEPETERQPVPEPPRPRVITPPRPAGPVPTGEGEEEPLGPSAAERVRAATPDARLLAPLSEEVVGLSPEQIARLELIWALEELNDSAAAFAEAARRARDWTYTDDEGKRWGISPGKLHLGDVTLPIPSFGGPYDPNAWKGSMDADLERASASAAARETLEERARAIRERKDREREEKADTTGGGGGGAR